MANRTCHPSPIALLEFQRKLVERVLLPARVLRGEIDRLLERELIEQDCERTLREPAVFLLFGARSLDDQDEFPFAPLRIGSEPSLRLGQLARVHGFEEL